MEFQETGVKVCILSNNRPRYLREAIFSVLGQTVLPDVIEVSDNGSDSAVFESVRDFVESGKVIWNGSGENKGVHWNLGRVFSQKNTGWPFLFAMHDDDRISPTFLEKQVGFLKQNPSVVAVACNALEIDEEGFFLNTFLHNPKKRERFEYYESVVDLVKLYMRTFLAFPSIVYRSSYAARIPVQSRFGQLADVRFLLDLAREGSIAYVNQPLLEYRKHKGQGSHAVPEEDCRNLEDFQISLTHEFPQLFPFIDLYVAKRRIYRYLKRLKKTWDYSS